MAQAQETAEYIVTEAAPPRVAGRPARPGQILTLTELQARSELLAGSIVPKPEDRKDDDPTPSGEFETTDELVQIRARAKGYKGAVVAAASAIEKSAAPATATVPPGTDPVSQRMSGAPAEAGTAGSGTASAGDADKTDAGSADAGASGSATGTDAGKRPGKASSAGTGA